jgi:hypothetical protein
VAANWERLLVIWFGVAGVVGTVVTEIGLSAIEATNALVSNQLIEIGKAEERLKGDIENLEDATRRNLNGIPEIFERSLWLIKNAEREIIYFNFVLTLGLPHAGCNEVVKRYSALEKTPATVFSVAVSQFWKEFETKALTVPKLQLLTLDDRAVIDVFLMRLKGRAGYEHLRDNETLSKVSDGETKGRRALNGIVLARAEHSEKQTEWREGTNMPIQVFIAGLPHRDGQMDDERYGCVVFLLGTESVAGVKNPASESGFYTELPHTVRIFRELVGNVAESYKTRVLKEESAREAGA